MGYRLWQSDDVTEFNSAVGSDGKRIIVENQTTTSPPGSPTVGTAYIIGPSATGGWSGDDNKIAICEVAGSFVIYTPTNGWEAYDKAKNNNYTFNGTAWISAAGAFIDSKRTETNQFTNSVNLIPTDDTIPQITEGDQVISTTFTPKSTTNKLRVRFEANVVTNTTNQNATAALFLNSNSNALRAVTTYLAVVDQVGLLSFTHEFVPATTSSITLSVRVGLSGSGQLFLNGNHSQRIFGGINVTSLTIDEIVA
jgi:hypothetical protein